MISSIAKMTQFIPKTEFRETTENSEELGSKRHAWTKTVVNLAEGNSEPKFTTVATKTDPKINRHLENNYMTCEHLKMLPTQNFLVSPAIDAYTCTFFSQ